MALIIKNLTLSIYKPQLFSVISIFHRVLTVILLFAVCVSTVSVYFLPLAGLIFFAHILYTNQQFFNIILILFLLNVMLAPFIVFFCLFNLENFRITLFKITYEKSYTIFIIFNTIK